MVSGQEIWLGVEPAVRLAGMGCAHIVHRVGYWGIEMVSSQTIHFYSVYNNIDYSPCWYLFLERRKAGMAVG